jgi:hypothetical protein
MRFNRKIGFAVIRFSIPRELPSLSGSKLVTTIPDYLTKGNFVKILLSMILVFSTVSAYAEDPAQAFENLVDAMYSQDAQGVYDILSPESVGLVNMMLLMVKAKSEEAAEEISTQLGVEITAEELRGWTTMDLISTVLAAPGFINEFPPRDDIVVSHFEIDGDSSVVFFNLAQIPGDFQVLLVLNGENWKLDQSVIQAEL